MHFTRLRVTGFKSFVDPAEIRIEPGVTGIVGPNGCGKSNLVDALRWIMGETSPKRMRGGGMDDVIFAGAHRRPPRTLAEAAVVLDNTDRSAPPALNDNDELEVVRRIVRESGSTYTVNGAEVRARDVQLLFTDMATGAHASGMVSQGQIGQLVEAKPAERRQLLDEAAGTAGLRARRHEAEQRLRAAEANLERLADAAGVLESRHRQLKRQARQAARYARLSAGIRAAQALLLLRLWRDAAAAAEATTAALGAAEQAVAEAGAKLARASAAQLAAAEKIRPLRDAQAAAAARLQRLELEREGLDADERRARDETARIRTRLEQCRTDIVREEKLGGDAAARIAALEREAAELAATGEGEARESDAAEQTLAAAAGDVREAASRADALADRLTAVETDRARLSVELAAARRRADDLAERRSEVASELARLGDADTAEAPEDPTLDDSTPEIIAASAAVASAREAHAAAARERAAKGEAATAAREALHDADALHRQTAAELAALAELLVPDREDGFPPLLDAVAVEPGYEAALAAALGEDLRASADSAAPARWVALARQDAPDLPDGAMPLDAFVRGPAALRSRLSQIGVVEAGRGEELRDGLAQGQRLVSQEGALWRWDGFTVTADADTRAAVRLRHQNRLGELRSRAADRKHAVDRLRAVYERARSEGAAADAAEAKAQTRLRDAEDTLRTARASHARAVHDAAANRERRASLRDRSARLDAEIEAARASRRRAAAALAGLPDPKHLLAELATAREALQDCREAQAEADRARARWAEAARARKRRGEAIASERETWGTRATEAESRLRRLAERRSTAEAELAVVAAHPAETAARRADLVEAAQDAAKQRAAAADALAAAEAELAELDRAVKTATGVEATTREAVARAESRSESAEERRREVARRLVSELDAGPERARDIAGLAEGEDLPPATEVEARLERLRREREQMGPINLRAKTEAEETAQQLDDMSADRADVEGAIRRLRTAIGSLNREGRQRVAAAFDAADRHFRALFARLFQGGAARLELVDSDDPLDAGLEILASPPGKRLRTLSLLSGGERALTAIALRFAVFLANPAPICVLDEVDAPLDDANVARFCDLIGDVARRTTARFLVITHHPLTMARMDRLFGVTMPEPGVSQIVSVDLAGAEALREAS